MSARPDQPQSLARVAGRCRKRLAEDSLPGVRSRGREHALPGVPCRVLRPIREAALVGTCRCEQAQAGDGSGGYVGVVLRL